MQVDTNLWFRKTTRNSHYCAGEKPLETNFADKCLDVRGISERHSVFVDDGWDFWCQSYMLNDVNSKNVHGSISVFQILPLDREKKSFCG